MEELKFADPYAHLGNLAAEGLITYPNLDARFVKDTPLFAIHENFNFSELKELINTLNRTLPAIKRIFAKPIIRLKDCETILPTEAVRVINSRSVSHVARHSELWSDIRDGMLIPAKLSTLQSENEYGIYENIAFCKAVDLTLATVRAHADVMRQMLFSCKNLSFNLLNRDDHVKYFLAIGKLHVSYVLDYEKYIGDAEACLAGLTFIENTLCSRLGSQIYKDCHKKSLKLPLKKTNIFRSHKDYAVIYKLMKMYAENDGQIRPENSLISATSTQNYLAFCNILTLFALAHFNFETDTCLETNLLDLKSSWRFKKWEACVENLPCGNSSGIKITVNHANNRKYSVFILPSPQNILSDELLDEAKKTVSADEYLLASPYSDEGDRLLLSIYDVDSFCRIQQILLKAMICSDSERDVCPFCGKELSQNPLNGDRFTCRSCRMDIEIKKCPKTELPYVETGIYRDKMTDLPQIPKHIEGYVRQRFIERAMHFRNITKIDQSARPICPKCGCVH